MNDPKLDIIRSLGDIGIPPEKIHPWLQQMVDMQVTHEKFLELLKELNGEVLELSAVHAYNERRVDLLAMAMVCVVLILFLFFLARK